MVNTVAPVYADLGYVLLLLYQHYPFFGQSTLYYIPAMHHSSWL